MRVSRGARLPWPAAQAGVTMLVTAVVAWRFGRSLPLTYDEAYNWNEFAGRGFVHSVTTYTVPNNHVLFTGLQSLLPHGWVSADPLSLRLLNILYASLLMALLVRWATRAGAPYWFAFAGTLVSSPLLVLYLGLARGYLLAALLTFLSIETLTRRHVGFVVASAVAMGLAVWTVPTSAFGMVGVAAVLLAARRRRDLLLWVGVSVAVALCLYAPILHDVMANTKTFGSSPAPGRYSASVLFDSLFLLSFGPRLVIGAVVLAAASVAAFVAVRRRVWAETSALDPAAMSSVFVMVAAYAVSMLLVVELGNVTGVIHAPFVRNAFPVACAAPVLLLRALTAREKRARQLAAVVVCANIVAGVVASAYLVTGHDYASRRYGDVLMTTPPSSLRDAAALGADTVRCSVDDYPACITYTSYLAHRGVRVVLAGMPVRRWRCVTGSVHPAPADQVTLLRGQLVLGVLCRR